MRREQMEQWLASDGKTVEEWCRLNRMSTSTLASGVGKADQRKGRHRTPEGTRGSALEDAERKKAKFEDFKKSRKLDVDN